MCPMLPGQTVNVLEIPHLAASAFVSSESTSHLTMDLQLRWKSPQAPQTQYQSITDASTPMPDTRRWWFSKSLARLQTAVVDHVIGDRPIASAREWSSRKCQQPPARATTVAGPCMGLQFLTNTSSRRMFRNSPASPSSIPHRTQQSRFAVSRQADSVLLNRGTRFLESELHRPVTWPGAWSRSQTEKPISHPMLDRRFASAYAYCPRRNADFAISDPHVSALQETRRLPHAIQDPGQAFCQHLEARTDSYLQLSASCSQFELNGTQVFQKPEPSHPAGLASTFHTSSTIFNSARSLWTPIHSLHPRDQTVAQKTLYLPDQGCTKPGVPISPRKTPRWSSSRSMLVTPDEGISLLMTPSSPPPLRQSNTPLYPESSSRPSRSPSVVLHCVAPIPQISAELAHDMRSPSSRWQPAVTPITTTPPPQTVSITLSTDTTISPIDLRQDCLSKRNQDAAPVVPVDVCSKHNLSEHHPQARTNSSSLASRRLLRRLNRNHSKPAGPLSVR